MRHAEEAMKFESLGLKVFDACFMSSDMGGNQPHLDRTGITKEDTIGPQDKAVVLRELDLCLNAKWSHWLSMHGIVSHPQPATL